MVSFQYLQCTFRREVQMRKIQWPRESGDVVFPKQPNGSAYVVLHRQLVYLESNKTSLINSLLVDGI
jgi:hypothetical protein